MKKFSSILTSIVPRNVSEQQFIGLYPKATISIENGEYRSYVIRNISIGLENCNLMVFFKSCSLTHFHITLCDKAATYDGSKFTEDELKKDKKEQDIFLEKWLGNSKSKNQYAWGTVESVIDQKSWSVSIIITYKKNKD